MATLTVVPTSMVGRVRRPWNWQENRLTGTPPLNIYNLPIYNRWQD